MLVLVLAGPFLKLDQTIEKKPVVALLFDRSRSMQLPAGPFETDADALKFAKAAGYATPEGRVDADARKALNKVGRARLVEGVVRANAKDLTVPLAEKYDLRYYSFAKGPDPPGSRPGAPRVPRDRPTPGPTTPRPTSATPSRRCSTTWRAGRWPGSSLFSDGQNTGGRSPGESARAAAAIPAPIFAVPAGSSARLQDVAITDVFTSGLVAVGDTARVTVTVESQGFEGRPAKLQLLDGETMLDQKDITLRGAEPQQMELTFEAKQPGAKYLTVRIPPPPEEPEALRENNSDVAFVRVGDERLKVLHIEGPPRWDFRFLKNALRRDHGIGGRAIKEQPDIVLEAEWRRLPDAQQAAALPATLDELCRISRRHPGRCLAEIARLQVPGPAGQGRPRAGRRPARRGRSPGDAAGVRRPPARPAAREDEAQGGRARSPRSRRPFKLELSPEGADARRDAVLRRPGPEPSHLGAHAAL